MSYSTRLESLPKRVSGSLDTCDISNECLNFDVKKVVNSQPNSVGVISTCIFGDVNSKQFQRRYIDPIFYNIKIAKTILPGWVVRVYISPTINDHLVDKFVSKGCEVYIMKNDSVGYSGTMWRFLPASETKPFISYDADMKLDEEYNSVPELAGNVCEWLDTPKPFFHRHLGLINFVIPISAGMWGSKGVKNKDGSLSAPIPDIQEKMEKYNSTWFGVDEAFLTREVFPLFNSQNVYVVRNNMEYMAHVGILILLIVIVIFLSYYLWKRIRKCSNESIDSNNSNNLTVSTDPTNVDANSITDSTNSKEV